MVIQFMAAHSIKETEVHFLIEMHEYWDTNPKQNIFDKENQTSCDRDITYTPNYYSTQNLF